MKFAVSRYNIRYRAIPTDPPPLPGARIEVRPYGFPPFQSRKIWIAEIGSLEEILHLVRDMGIPMEVSLSAYWSGSSIGEPGHCLFGISLIDDPSIPIDPRDQPIMIKPLSSKPK